MNKVKTIFKKHWITIWLVIATVACGCCIIVYAKYDNNYNTTKRVIAADKSSEEFFTSNTLKNGGANSTVFKPVGYSGSTDFEIYIYNYDRTDTGEPYPETINYKLSVALVNENGTTLTGAQAEDLLGNVELLLYGYTNKVKDSEPLDSFGKNLTSKDYNMSLIPGTETYLSDHFTLTIPSGAIDKAYLKITAQPNPPENYPGLSTLSGVFSVQTQTITLSSGWAGEFSTSSSVLPKNYDGFNYVITGSGDETKRLSWDASLLTPNKQEMLEFFSISDISSASTDSTTGYKYFDIPLSSATNGGRYDIQFYIVDSTARNLIDNGTQEDPTPMSWATLGQKVTLTDPT